MVSRKILLMLLHHILFMHGLQVSYFYIFYRDFILFTIERWNAPTTISTQKTKNLWFYLLFIAPKSSQPITPILLTVFKIWGRIFGVKRNVYLYEDAHLHPDKQTVLHQRIRLWLVRPKNKRRMAKNAFYLIS